MKGWCASLMPRSAAIFRSRTLSAWLRGGSPRLSIRSFCGLYYHSALEDHALADAFYEQFVSRFIALVEQLIDRGIEEGRFRNVDTSIAARAFTGMLRSYFLTNELFPRHALKGDPREISLSFCGLFLDGVTNHQMPKSGVVADPQQQLVAGIDEAG